MIKVKGKYYYNDYNMGEMNWQFENIGQFKHWIMTTINKQDLRIPMLDDGTVYFNNFMAFKFCKEHNGGDNRYESFDLIEEDGKIMYSNGNLTNNQGHCGKRCMDMFKELKEWKECPYEYID